MSAAKNIPPAADPQTAFPLALSGGARFLLQGADPTAAAVVAFWAGTAGLASDPVAERSAPACLAGDTPLRLLARTVHQDPGSRGPGSCLIAGTAGEIDCPLEERGAPRRLRKITLDGRRRRDMGEAQCLTEDEWSWRQLARLSACIGREMQRRGGVLLHSGLAEHPLQPGNGFGFLMAGRSGVGKSTACRRLPPPWRPLSDDMALVARDKAGSYWAHPFPTWSRFFGKETDGGPDAWDVQHAVPLRALLILEQAARDRLEPIGRGHALSMLAVSARQASSHFVFGWPADRLAEFHSERFRSLRDLVGAVPAFHLHVSREGAFWIEIAELFGTLTEHGR